MSESIDPKIAEQHFRDVVEASGDQLLQQAKDAGVDPRVVMAAESIARHVNELIADALVLVVGASPPAAGRVEALRFLRRYLSLAWDASHRLTDSLGADAAARAGKSLLGGAEGKD